MLALIQDDPLPTCKSLYIHQVRPTASSFKSAKYKTLWYSKHYFQPVKKIILLLVTNAFCNLQNVIYKLKSNLGSESINTV